MYFFSIFFNSKIKPILLFGCEIWGISESIVTERLHMKFCRYVLGIHYKSAPHQAIRGDLGRHSLLVNMFISCIKYWLYILSLSTDRYLKQCYEFQFKKAERGQEC